MKKLLAVAAALLLLIPAGSIFAEEMETTQVYVDGALVEADVPAVIVDGRTMLPFRAIFNALGVPDEQIRYDGKTNTIEVSGEGRYIYIAIGVKGIVTNKGYLELEVAPFIYQERTLVPVRAVSELLGAAVEWDGTRDVVQITSKAE